jgi:hypothetical protein
MKPKTKLQIEIVGLSKKLPKITEAQANWGYKKLFLNYASQLNKNIYCLECGHKWKQDFQQWQNEIVTTICPECNSNLNMFTHNGNCRKTEYFSVITTKGDYQVQRIIMIHKDMKKKIKAKTSFIEVLQHWIGVDGRKTTLSLAVTGMSIYYDKWIYGSGMEIRGKSQNSHLRDNLSIDNIYPRMKIQPLIRRNGFNGKFHTIPPFKIFSLLLKENLFEILLKNNQISAAKYLANSYNQKMGIVSKEYIEPLKTIIRKNYIINDFSIWKDYIKLLIYFRRDIKNEKYVCPLDLNKEHNKLVEKKRNHQKKMNFEKLKSEIKVFQKSYHQQKKDFFNLKFEKENIAITPIKTVKDFMYEGDVLEHCLFANEYFKKENSLILSARVNNIITETIEIKLDILKVNQCRGRKNKPTEYHDQILELMNSSLPEIEKVINLKIKQNVKTRINKKNQPLLIAI